MIGCDFDKMMEERESYNIVGIEGESRTIGGGKRREGAGRQCDLSWRSE